MNKEDLRRSVKGLILGGLFGAALGAGFTGFWDWIYLFYIPVVHGTGVLNGLVLGGLVGIIWGFLATIFRRLWIGIFLGGGLILAALAFSVGITLPLITLPIIAMVCVLAGFLRGFLKIFQLACNRWNRLKLVWIFLVFLTPLLFGLAITWPLDQVNESMDGRRAALQKVYRYSQAQSWKVNELQIESMESGYANIVVFLSNGEIYRCRVLHRNERGSGEPAIYDILDITCQP